MSEGTHRSAQGQRATQHDHGAPERFEPAQMRGELVAAEHLVRYSWATPLVRGAHVLDAGCGTAYGAALLARSATSVVGVDIAEAVLEAARPHLPANVELLAADLHALPQPDHAFDAVVCFEAIEHVPDPEPVLDELRRVLRPGGLLVVSTPNRDHYPPGNEHHHHELTAAELRAALASRFEHVLLHRQQAYITSAIFDDASYAQDDGLVALSGALKTVGAAAGEETYTLALASDALLPNPDNAAALTGDVELRRWLEIYQQQQTVLHGQLVHLNDLQSQLHQHDDLVRRLAEAEAELASLPRLPVVEEELDHMRHDLNQTHAALQQANAFIAEVMASTSWRVSQPVRWAGRWRDRRGR